MRLRKLELHNFKCFADAELDLEPATVLVGANNSGKSTILDAIALLFGTATAPHWTRLLTAPSDKPPENSDEFVAVIGSFDDLTQHEREVWEPVIEGGSIRFGRFLNRDVEVRDLFIVFTEALWAQFLDLAIAKYRLEQAGSEPEDLASDDIREQLGDLAVARELGYVWVPVDLVTEELIHLLPWDEPYPDPWADVPRNIAAIRGPEGASPSPADLVRPIIAGLVDRHLTSQVVFEVTPGTEIPELGIVSGRLKEDALGQLERSARTAVELVASRFRSVSARYLGEGRAANLRWRGGANLIEAAIGSLEVTVDRRGESGSAAQDSPSGRSTDPALSTLGAGARRSAALAALEMYRDPELWPPEESVLLLIEEPEVGLHPAAQRRVAEAIRDLPTYGVQAVVVTHSPVFVNAAPEAGIRLVRARLSEEDPGRALWRHEVVRPTRLHEVIEEVGAKPADILLAKRFVVVEGPSDRQCLSAWARTLGSDFESWGVQLVPAYGHSKAALVAQFLELAYEGSSIVVLLDAGSHTSDTKAELEERFGPRIAVRLLPRTEIEGFFTAGGVAAWLETHGIEVDEAIQADVEQALGGVRRKAGLRVLARQQLGREYSVSEDGGAIARLMLESEISPDIRGLVAWLVQP